MQQILLALAAVAAFQPRRAVEIADGDIGGLLLAAALGAFYLGLMTFIVKWYGDQPVDAAWYLARAHGLWLGFLVAAILFGAVAPIVGCAWERVRGSPSALRFVGVSTIVGVGLHDVWLAGYGTPWLTASTALLAVIAMAGISAGLRAALWPVAGTTRRACSRREAVMSLERNEERGAACDRRRHDRRGDGRLLRFRRALGDRPLRLLPNARAGRDIREAERIPAPRLQTLPDGLRDPEIARQQADLERFRWIDKARGAFQIPIAQAMRLVAERGTKAYDPVPASPPPPKAAIR